MLAKAKGKVLSRTACNQACFLLENDIPTELVKCLSERNWKKLRLNQSDNFFIQGFDGRGEEFLQFSLLINKIFTKIPGGFLIVPSVQVFVGKPSVKGMLVYSFDRYLIKHLESHPIIFGAKLLDVFNRSRLLPSEIVGRKTENGDLVPIFLV